MKRLFLLLAIGVFAAPAGAQSPVAIEVTGDVAQPTRTFGAADLDTGFGLGVNVRYRFMPHLAAYGGWEWHHSRSGGLIAGQKLDVEDNGYTFGLRFEQPITARTGYWVRAGGLYNHIEIENEVGNLITDSGHGLGWEAGGGLALPLTARLTLTPGVRYRTLTHDMEIGGTTNSRTLSYVTIGTGLNISF
jgi:opacity protein-like surface antigen